jgi:UDP-N-acetylglucosamine acyltransferase
LVHQFARIGCYSFVGGGSRVPKDVPPYVIAVGSPMKLYGLNKVGLERSGFAKDTTVALKRAYRLLFMSDLPMSKALERAATELPPLPEITHLLDFMRESERGVAF